MELLQITHFGKTLRLEASRAGWQVLYWGDDIVSQITASEALKGNKTHQFEFVQTHIVSPINGEQTDPAIFPGGCEHKEQRKTILCQLEVELNWQPFIFNYTLSVDGEAPITGARTTKDIERQTPVKPVVEASKLSLIGLGSLALKFFKSAKLIKVVLAGASVAAYSWFFSWQFALALIGCLVFHEYGHIRAMKYFGMKTKGIYLIPFVGGLAVTDEKINTRWQDVVISIMGPTFGLIMSLLCMLLYWVTGSEIFAGLAVFNALLNLFNLLPILPLDGGHILKSISFSMHSVVGLCACLLAAALGILLSYYFSLALLGFMLLIGSVEIVFEWRSRFNSHLLPLDRYGQLFSAGWYLLTILGLLSIIFYFASTGDELLSLPLIILGQ